MLSIVNAKKEFGTHKVLSDVSFSIEENTIVGLAGPSGSGKSTLLRCIQKLEELDSGEIFLHVRSGFMFQDFQLFPHMSVLQNLVYAPKLQNKAEDHKPYAMELIQKLGIEDKAHSYPDELSGGQKQRVALCRSLMMRPKLLLCDEPTSGLDVATIDEVVSLLCYVRDMGVTMVIASHDLDFLTSLADRIILLKSGQIAADVQPKLIENPIKHLKNFYLGG